MSHQQGVIRKPHLIAIPLALAWGCGDASPEQQSASGPAVSDPAQTDDFGAAPGEGATPPQQPAISQIAGCDGPSPGVAPIRRLTRFEYSNTLRDLLGDTQNRGSLLPPELKGNGFGNDAASLTTTRAHADAYRSNASNLATELTGDPDALAQLVACDVAALGEQACAEAFVTSFGQRAYRRPLTPEESQVLLQAYAIGAQGADFASGIAAVIELVLQAPQFLYRVELGVPMEGLAVARPTNYEYASRLSYLLWGSMPDQGLLDAAAAGQLENPAQLLAQAERMLQDPRARDVVRHFTTTFLEIAGIDGLERNAEFFPTYSVELSTLFRLETEHLIDHVVWEGEGNLAGLYTAPFTFVNEPLAQFYGFPPVAGDAFQRVALDTSRRAGVLTHASILAKTTPGSRNNPVVRGKFVYEGLLCGHVPDPPPGLVVTEPDPDPDRTTRERFLVHQESPSCKGCHAMLDPIGFGFEHFDGVGLWRDDENGKPIDDTGEIPDTDIAGTFNGPVELGQKLAASRDARDCFAGQWVNYAYGRNTGPEDMCTTGAVQQAFQKSEGNIQQLLLDLTQTDAFLYRPLTEASQ